MTIYFRFVAVGVFLLLAGLAHPRLVVAQIDQDRVAQQLLGGDRTDQSRALEAVRRLSPAETSPGLRNAIFATLRSEQIRLAKRRSALSRGELIQAEEDDLYGRLLEAVVRLRDPSTIPALSEALGTGMMVIKALVEFGEAAAPDVLRVVRSPDTPSERVNDGLVALRMMVENSSTKPLTSRTVTLIRAATIQRLSNRQGATTLIEAIDLAAAIDDPDARKQVEILASDWNAVVSRGVEDPELIERIQRHAIEALAKGRSLRPLP